ncbi:hypothetical protein BV20DRAFT_960763 [Pilatotrama ljubarskyi]|nr:hypothetical protein BV20DRAFT_960763 [Pilatotrama ljubarskyi]
MILPREAGLVSGAALVVVEKLFLIDAAGFSMQWPGSPRPGIKTSYPPTTLPYSPAYMDMERTLSSSSPSSTPPTHIPLELNTVAQSLQLAAPTNSTRSDNRNRTGRADLTRAAVPRSAPPVGVWHKLKVFLGYAGQSERARARRRLLVSLNTSLVLGSVQIVVTAVLTSYGVSRIIAGGEFDGQSEFVVCKDLAIMNMIWLGRTILATYIFFWFYRTSHPRTDDAFCPLDLIGMHILTRKILPFVTMLCFIIPVIFLAQRGRTCLTFAPHITALTLTILCLFFLRFTISKAMSLLLCTRVAHGSSAKRQLTRAEVDRIPSVYYIPPPPDDSPASPISLPERALSFPSAPIARTQRRKAHRFVVLRSLTRSSFVAEGDLEQGGNRNTHTDGTDDWEANWAPAELPYVRLEENQATCSICRLDFEAPPRRADSLAVVPEGGDAHGMASSPSLPQRPRLTVQPSEIVEVRVRVESSLPGNAPQGQSADAGSGTPPRPLRLLSCGHAFHKECIDIWLLEHEAWCPNCKGAIEIPSPPGSKWMGWRRARTA